MLDTGDVTSISVLGRLVVFANSARAAKDLFEHTGTRYMDRPAIPIIDMYVTPRVFETRIADDALGTMLGYQ